MAVSDERPSEQRSDLTRAAGDDDPHARS
jgi:hypothetical protein